MYIEMPGADIAPIELSIAKAKAAVTAIASDPFIEIVECKRLSDEIECIIIDAKIELGQYRTHKIHPIERLALCFTRADTNPPEVLALRDDFPLVPHLNLREIEIPRSLCLFDKPYAELKRRWTASWFLDRIREWLALTAKGSLHGEDQPLEPLLPYSLDQLVLPADLFGDGENGAVLSIKEPIIASTGVTTLVAQKFVAESDTKLRTPYIAIALKGEPQTHGLIHAAPQTLYELHQFLSTAQIDLLPFLRRELTSLQTHQHPAVMDAKLIFIIGLGKTRSDTSSTEAAELRAFVMDHHITDIGADIGIWEQVDGKVGKLLFIDEAKVGQSVTLKLLNPQWSLTPELAAIYNGTSYQSKQITLVGAGTLGSQIFMNLARKGYGQWVIIDDDILLPHNLARHLLPNAAVGYPKATSIAQMANELFVGEIAKGIAANVLDKTVQDDLAAELINTDVILDVSASVEVARTLSIDLCTDSRRISLFLNPTGTDLVVLAEDNSRSLPLDLLEMQYYRGILHDQRLHSHLQKTDEQIRYASSCRDVSMTLSQDLIAQHAAMASQAIQRIDETVSLIRIWQANPDELTYNSITLTTAKMLKVETGNWSIITDSYLIDKLVQARQRSLPNETGGVLIGAYDLGRKIIYVIDTILSPSDSIEWPTVYIRGYRNLQNELAKVGTITANQLEYVGEWHSHPDGVAVRPSATDRQAFEWLTKVMNADGLPPLLLIIGQNAQHQFTVERICD